MAIIPCQPQVLHRLSYTAAVSWAVRGGGNFCPGTPPHSRSQGCRRALGPKLWAATLPRPSACHVIRPSFLSLRASVSHL